jgi:hypothetical protein
VALGGQLAFSIVYAVLRIGMAPEDQFQAYLPAGGT